MDKWMRVTILAVVLTVLMLADLNRSLPWQNIVVIVATLLAGEGLVAWYLSNGDAPTIAGNALYWMALVLVARKIGQIVLRPLRWFEYYGSLLIVLSSLVTAIMQLRWPASIIRFASTAIFLFVLTPWFIQKRPVTTES